MDEILDLLNEEQIKPVRDTEGQVLVLAGAGSGKTRVLTSRIAYILREGLAMPSQILAITFTNKAAGEMKERLENMIGDVSRMWICTIHSMCVRILRTYPEQSGIKPNFSIYSETERNNVIKKTYKELDYDDDKLLKSAKYHIGNAKMLGLDPDQYATKYHYEPDIEDVVRIYDRYNRHLSENNALDFDDLLLYTLRLLRSCEEAREYLSDRFKYIHVDEFQDTNAVQYNIIKLLAYKHVNLFAVGDDDQSIYGWRGAQIDNILKFDRDYPSAKVYKLERNYRSTKPILDLANAIIRNNQTRRSKTLWTNVEEGQKPSLFEAEDETGEALYAARTISQLMQKGAKYSDFAVLMRINALTRSYESEFTKYGIPYKVFGGFKFFERKEIKDILAYMRLISNPDDNEALERIINVPKRGIGGKTVEAMQNYADSLSLTLFDACIDVEHLGVNAGTKAKIISFRELLLELVRQSMTLPVNQLVRTIIDQSNIRDEYDDGTDEGDSKLANLDEYIASVDDYSRLNPEATLSEYLNAITLYSDTDDMDDGEYVTLATIHSVKGLEYDNVFICGLEQGIMPTSRAAESIKDLEEERRLMYVAITRAKTRLYLTRSKSRYLYGRREQTAFSIFLNELTKELGLKQDTKRSFGGLGGGFGSGGGNPYNSGYYSSQVGYVKGFGGYGGSAVRRMGGTYGATNARKATYSEDGYYSDTPFEEKAPTPHKSTIKPGLGGFTAKKPTVNNNSYEVGDKVKHTKFGIGTIISIKNKGTSGEVLCIAFEGQGIKELSAAIAPLTKL